MGDETQVCRTPAAKVALCLGSRLLIDYRCDYFGSSQQFVLRMLSKPHEVVRGELEFKLLSHLRTLPGHCPDEASVRFAQEIDDHGSATVNSTVGAPYSRHDPDISFGHPAADYPGVIVEIAYCQKVRALK